MKEITTEQEWEKILQESNDHPVVIMKHSNTCPISARGYSQVQQFTQEHEPVSVYVAVVQNSPELKQKIAKDTNVVHESPQVLIVQEGKAVFHVSHYDITKEELSNQLTNTKTTSNE